MRERGARGAVAMLVIASIVTFSSQSVSACSCGSSTPQQQIEWSDAGFIGTLVASARNGGDGPDDGATFSFDVEVWLNGDLDSATVEVESSAYGASCGIEVPIGERAAIFVQQQGNRLTSGLCSTLGADTTLAALDPTPVGGGTAVMAVPGLFTDGGYALLDADGGVVGYRGTAEESFPPRIHLCSDGRHAIAVGFPLVEVLDLLTFEVVTTIDTAELQQHATIADVGCTGPDPGDTLLMVESGPGPQVDTRSLAAPDEPGTTFERERAGRPALVMSDVWMREYLDPGEQLVILSPDGERAVLEVIERPEDSNFAGYESIVADPSGSNVAVSQVTYRSTGVNGELSIRDGASGNEIVSTPASGVAVVGWTNDGRLITHASTGELGNLEVRDASRLDILSTVRSWPAWGATIIGDEVWGTSSGTVYRGSLATGNVETTTVLPSQVSGKVIALIEPIEVEPGEVREALIIPRAPAALTESEVSARSEIEATSVAQVAADARGDATSVGKLSLVILLALSALAGAAATISRVRDRMSPTS